MPTYRKLHTKIIDSYDFAEMPDDFTRVFWMLLIVVVDSEGRAIDNPAWLRSKVFPLRSDVEISEIEAAMDWLTERGLIIRYQVDNRKFFYVVNFKKYQSGTEKEARSVLPAPIKITPELVKSNSVLTSEEVGVAASASASASVSVNAYESVNGFANVFAVYESEIGILTPTITEELKLAEQEYPPGYVEYALREASKNNKRSWKYAQAILKRLKVDGLADNKLNDKQPHVSQPITIVLPNGQLSEAKT